MKRRFIIILAVLTLAAVVTAGCLRTGQEQPPNVTGGPEDSIRTLFEQADQYYRNNQYEKALERFINIIETAPNSKYAAPSLYKIGGIHMKRKNFEKAIMYFDKLIVEHTRSKYAIEAYYNKGFCYLNVGDAKAAIDALEDYLVRNEAAHKTRARVYLSRAYSAAGDYTSALVTYSAAASAKTTKDTLIEILSEVKELVDDHASIEDMRAAAKKSKSGYVQDYLNFRIALAALGNDDKNLAALHIKRVDFSRARFAFYKEADKLRTDLLGITPTPMMDKDEGPKYKIGVLLPLSGRFSVFGEQVLHGVMLGVDFFGKSTEGGAVIEVVVKDSKGEAEAAVDALQELAADPEVMCIIGPLMKDASLAAANKAQALGIPLITLATHRTICDIGDWVFRNAMTLDAQVKDLISYAHQHKGCRRFAILYPDNKLGRMYADLFQQYMDPRANMVTAKRSYTSKDVDFRIHVRSLKAGGDFDALFIPGKADDIGIIAPQLVYFGIKGKVLLGTPSWNNHILAKKASGYLDDTVIVDSFFIDSRKPNISAFVQSYKQDFGEDPTHLSGHGYDTVAILSSLFAKGYGESRASVRSGLLGVHQFEGVTGATTFLENGDVDKDLALLMVGPAGIEELF